MKEKNKVINNNDVALLVVSCDAYKDLWNPYFHSLFKYWPDCPYPIYLGSNENEFSDSRVKSILIGPDKDYSSNLLAMLDHIESPWVIIWIEDLFLSETVNTAYISKLVSSAQREKVGYLKLTTNTPMSFIDNKTQMIGPIPIGVKYRLGIGLGLWNKETLIKLLIPGENAWQIERNGSHRSNSFKEPFYALSTNARSNPNLIVINSVIKGKWNLDVLPFLKKEGFGYCLPNRQKISLLSYLYGRIYKLRLKIFRIMRKYWYE